MTTPPPDLPPEFASFMPPLVNRPIALPRVGMTVPRVLYASRDGFCVLRVVLPQNEDIWLAYFECASPMMSVEETAASPEEALRLLTQRMKRVVSKYFATRDTLRAAFVPTKPEDSP